MELEAALMRILRTILILTTGMGFMLLQTGCGGQSLRSAKKSFNTASVAGDGVSTPSSSTTTPTTSTTTTTTTSGVSPLTFPIRATGYTTVTVNVSANKKLKAKFTPGVADTTIAGYGATAVYTKLGVYIGIGDTTSPTALLSNGADGSAVQTSSIFDLSNKFNRTCQTTDTACRDTVTITVTKPNYDYFCINCALWLYQNANYCNLACPNTHVYDTHPWNGTLTVQTDDTDAI